MSDYTLIPDRWTPVTPSDSATFPAAMAIYVGNGGTVVAAGIDGQVASFIAQAGAYLPGRFTKVMSTGTTASGIVACYQR